jgi:hypothetical protein
MSVFIFAVAAQQKLVKEQKIDLMALKQNVNSKIDETVEKVKTENLKGIEIKLCSFEFEKWSKDLNVEKATSIRLEWYSRLAKGLSLLSNFKTIMEVYEDRNLKASPKYIEAKNNHEECLKKLLEVYKNPPKVKGNK